MVFKPKIVYNRNDFRVKKMKKNEKFILTCTSYTFEGMGVAKHEGFPVFIKDMLVEETGEVVITKVLKNYAYGRCLKLLKKSTQRVLPACPIFKQCGGCQLQHMSFDEQQAFKRQRVQDCFSRIAKSDLIVENVLSMQKGWHYRNKGQVPVGVKEDQVVCGFYRIHSNEIIDMNECLIQHPLINEVVQEIKSYLQIYQIGDYFRHLLVKVGFKTKQVMVVLIVKDKNIPYLDELVAQISQNKQVHSIILNINQRKDNVILGEQEILLYGSPTIEDELDGLKFNLSSKSFYQVNPIQTQVLYQKALEFANITPQDTVLDLYCGIGTISLFMARHAKKVIGIEIVPEAIEDAKKNAKINQIDNIEFVCSDAGAYASKLAQKNIQLDVVCVDPPRKGCDEVTLSSLLKMTPKRIVYVSCDPSTCARDCKYLEEHGYRLEKIQPVDMFPNSFHVETVVLMSKVNLDR